jgi:ribonucleoside-diphosphate reductase alpha chain
MIGLNCSHPDIEDFLKVKQNDTAIQSANLSILFTDEFMKAVENDSYYECSFTIPETGEKISKAIRARDFFMDFCKSQWDYAEPGALYIDKIRNYNLLSGYPESIYHIDICNPCAEFCGNSYNACNLGSINLYNIVDNPFTNKSCINYEKLEKLVELGVIALDEILDYGYDMQPLDANRKCISDWRAIGLGVFGLADMFIALGVRYGSDKSIKVVKDIMTTIFNTAVETSAKLARDKGTFGKYEWKYIKESPLIKALPTVIYRFVEQYGLRNGSLISVAPTGSIATMTGLSGGVEPLYQISYERTTHALEKTGKTFTVVAKSVEHLMNKLDISLDRAKEFDSVIASHDINPLDRIKLQSMMQIYDDNAISSTINLKHEATVEDIFNAYIEAWRSGCKGITVFRDGCARTSILGKQKEDKKEEKDIVFDNLTPVKIGETDFRKYIKHTACVDKLYVFAGHDEQNNIVEVFTNIVQGCTSNIGTITRLTSALLRSGVKIDYIIKQLRKTKCQGCIKAREKGNDVSLSCGNAIADAIEEEYKRLKQEVVAIDESGLLECPECHKKTLRPEGKCFTCQHCGWSKCE